jgi:hypothetical protein
MKSPLTTRRGEAKVEIEAAGSDMLRSLTLSPSQGVAVPLRDATDAFSRWN